MQDLENSTKDSGGGVNEFLHAPGFGGFEIVGTLAGEPLSNGKYVNAKLITWDNEVRTRFREGKYIRYIDEIPACHATGVLKIGSVYRQGSNYHLQVFSERVQNIEKEMLVLKVNSVTTTIATIAGVTRLIEPLEIFVIFTNAGNFLAG